MNFSFDFTNYRNHPTNRKYVVFFFKNLNQANYFETLLVEHKLWYERHFDEAERKTYFAVEKKEEKLGIRLNHLSYAKYRKKFIAEPSLRWIVIVISAIVLGLAVTGFIISNF